MAHEGRRDLYNADQRFEEWLTKAEQSGIEGLNTKNSKLILQCVKDLRIGLNVSSKSRKGARGCNRLNHFICKLVKVISLTEQRGVTDITRIKAEELHSLFDEMRSGKIPNRFGTGFKSAGDYCKDFKAFWHWYQKVMSKQGKAVMDVTEELDSRGEKPKFVYFVDKDYEKILERASYDLKPILALAFDAGMRVTELFSIRVSDFSNDFKEVNIRPETSKTFGRKIKLMLCSEQIKHYVAKLELSHDSLLAQLHPVTCNKELRQLGKKILSPQQIKDKNLTLYDFRHSSACYWLPKYKSENALKYRFGWKKSDMIFYYTELLGMKDTITQDDMYTDISKTELEKRIAFLEFKIGALVNKVHKLSERTIEK